MCDKKRYFVRLAYDGTRFHGWQVQPNALTVQELLDRSLSTVLREQIETVGCGRTDAGVHAKDFYAHFDSASPRDLRGSGFLQSINALLPYEIAVKSISAVSLEAHARFDATMRSYEYHIHQKKDPFKHQYSWLMRDELNFGEMNKAAAILLQYTDFSCFSKSNTQVFTNNCKITRAEWIKQGDSSIFHISADRFLRNMVRAIVGTLIMVGKEQIPAGEIHDIIASKSRSKAGTSVPACGLYLSEIVYPYI